MGNRRSQVFTSGRPAEATAVGLLQKQLVLSHSVRMARIWPYSSVSGPNLYLWFKLLLVYGMQRDAQDRTQHAFLCCNVGGTTASSTVQQLCGAGAAWHSGCSAVYGAGLAPVVHTSLG